MKRILTIISLIFLTNTVQAFEDCVISSDKKLTDISIENNKIIDVYPVITIMNDKNLLIVHPLAVGKTRFCVLKGSKEKVMFDVEVTENKTNIKDVEGFDILPIDTPPNLYKYELDMPPTIVPSPRGEGKGEGLNTSQINDKEINLWTH